MLFKTIINIVIVLLTVISNPYPRWVILFSYGLLLLFFLMFLTITVILFFSYSSYYFCFFIFAIYHKPCFWSLFCFVLNSLKVFYSYISYLFNFTVTFNSYPWSVYCLKSIVIYVLIAIYTSLFKRYPYLLPLIIIFYLIILLLCKKNCLLV